ncbi:NAD-dependent protein deacetylase sirtuin-2, partial [Coemansia sp. RSA 2704]
MADIEELAKQLDESLSLGGKPAAPNDRSNGDGSDAESSRSVPSAVGPQSSSDEDSDGDAAKLVGLMASLTIHKPGLPAGIASVFADAASSIDSIASMIASGAAKRVIVMAGAGISTDAGIPDFRSAGTGLYANLQKYR